MGEEGGWDLKRALAWPGFVPPKARVEDAAGIAHEAREIRHKLILRIDDGAWLPPAVLRKVLWEESDGEDEGEEVDEAGVEQWMDPEDDAYWKYLKKLDPSNWKDQDHYRVLGLRRLRFASTPEQIRTAYRAKVVHHHPDKRRQRGEAVKDEDHDYFTCITRAHETLSNRHKRRAYDSVDPHFKDSTPSLEEARKQKDNFYGLFRACFETNARWSTVQPVPKLGDAKSDYDAVMEFYSFWFEFTSWREFSYLDEEDKDKGENREERRWIERQNKSERDRRRKEETKRIRTLVETAYAVDPRIAGFKEEEKRKKEEEKDRRREAIRLRKEEERQAREAAEAEAAAAKAAAEAEERKRREEERREKQAGKKDRQRQRKLLEAFCKEVDYFETCPDAQLTRMEELTKLVTFCSLEDLKALNDKLRKPNGTQPREAFANCVAKLEERLAAEAADSENRLIELKRAEEEERASNVATWTSHELQLLVKAASQLFPVGARARYENIASFINEHRKPVEGEPAGREKTARDVIAKAKEMGNVESGGEAKEAVKATTIVLGSGKGVGVTAAATQVTEGEVSTLWSADEQKQLESALRSVPAKAADRWDQIAALVPTKSRQECVRRYKELAELVKAKRAAAQNKLIASATK